MYPKILALEKNILKYRSFQMILLLHQVETLKSHTLNSIRSSDKIRGIRDRLPEGTKKVYKKLWKILVDEGIITENESEDLQDIIDIRNDIAHNIPKLFLDFTLKTQDKIYDYYALDRFEKYRDKIFENMSKNYTMTIGLPFFIPEKIIKEELYRLNNKIIKQVKKRKN